MLGNYQPGVSLTIDRFSGYWLGWSSNPHPYNTVTYTIVTSDATVLSLAKEGSLDWVSDYLQLSTYQSLHTQLGWQFMNYSTATFYMIKMNTQKAPLNRVLYSERQSRWLSTTRRCPIFSLEVSSSRVLFLNLTRTITRQ